jgi:hypothetical protein
MGITVLLTREKSAVVCYPKLACTELDGQNGPLVRILAEDRLHYLRIPEISTSFLTPSIILLQSTIVSLALSSILGIWRRH